MGSSYRSADHANGEEAAGVSDEIRLEYFLLPWKGPSLPILEVAMPKRGRRAIACRVSLAIA